MEKEISKNLQDSIIYLAITDTDFAKAIGGQVPKDLFSSQILQTVYDISVAYVNQFGEAPGIHFQDELIPRIQDYEFEEREAIARYLMHLEGIGKPNKNYVVSKLNDFIKNRKLVNALYDSAELLQRDKTDQAISVISDAVKAGLQISDQGYNYFDLDDLQERSDKPESLFKIGIGKIDSKFRICRSDLIVIAGGQKGGKSWFCHYIAKQALKKGLKVLHVSHELSLEETLKRYDMMFGALADSEHDIQIEIKKRVSTGSNRFKTERHTVSTIYNKTEVERARKRLEKWGGQLRIKKYPMGYCTAQELTSYINNLENFEGFLPDVVINDYADIMAPTDSSKQTRDSINDIYMKLKGIADDKKLVMINPTQVNGDGAEKLKRFHTIEGNDLSEDRRKFANIDKGLFICPYDIPNDYGFGEAVIGCFANRNGMIPGRVIVGQNISIGQVALYNYSYHLKEE